MIAQRTCTVRAAVTLWMICTENVAFPQAYTLDTGQFRSTIDVAKKPRAALGEAAL